MNITRRNSGFTLIELLIVIVIISIVAGVAMMTLNTNQHKQFETLAGQITNRLLLAEQEAMLRPATLGFAVNTQSFQFYIFQHIKDSKTNGWQALDEPALGKLALPDNSQVTLSVLGKHIPNNGSPHLIISPSGDISPFVILIGKRHNTPYYQITGKANGEIHSALFSPN